MPVAVALPTEDIKFIKNRINKNFKEFVPPLHSPDQDPDDAFLSFHSATIACPSIPTFTSMTYSMGQIFNVVSINTFLYGFRMRSL